MKRCLIVLAFALGMSAAVLSLPRANLEDSERARTVRAHLAATTSADYEVRNQGQAALAAIGPEAAPFLIATLEDCPSALETLLIRFAGRFGFPKIEVSTPTQLRVRAAEQLAAVAPDHERTVPALVRALREEQSDVVQEAQRALRRIGPHAAVPELTRALSSRDSDQRRHAAEVLRDFGSQAAHATGELLKLLRDRNASVRVAAVSALGHIGSAEVVPALSRSLDDRNPEVRRSAAEALAYVGTNSITAAARLRDRLNDSHPRVRVASAKALWLIQRDVAVVPVLIAALNEPVSWEAALALGAIGSAASDAVPALIERMKREKVPRPLRETPVAALALGQIGKASVPALIQTLNNAEPRTRTSAALALGLIGLNAASATPQLVQLLSDSDADVRRAATLSLGAIDPARKELVPALLVMANDEDIFLSSLAASTLQRIAPESAASVRRE